MLLLMWFFSCAIVLHFNLPENIWEVDRNWWFVMLSSNCKTWFSIQLFSCNFDAFYHTKFWRIFLCSQCIIQVKTITEETSLNASVKSLWITGPDTLTSDLGLLFNILVAEKSVLLVTIFWAKKRDLGILDPEEHVLNSINWGKFIVI